MNIFSEALAKLALEPAPMPPPAFNLKVRLLGPGRAEGIAKAVNEGWLDGYILGGDLWVNRGELHDLVAPGHCTYDEHDSCCYIPPEFIREVPENTL